MAVSRRTAVQLLASAGALPALSTLTNAQQPKRGGTLRLLVHPEPPQLVLALGQASGTGTIGSKIYESLIRFDFKLNPIPSLAKSWEISPDGKTYTFKLQDGVKWHDGKPFTAEDVVFTTQQLLMQTHPRARTAFERVEKAEVIDVTTVRYILKEVYSPFLYAFETSGCPMMPKHLYEGTDYAKNPANARPIGTGPFKFVEWKKGEQVILERNPDYWEKGLPYLDKIQVLFIPDASARTVAMEQGLIDVAAFDATQFSDLARLRKNPNLTLSEVGQEFISPHLVLDINNRKAPLSDKRFRQAMMMTLDREFIRDKIFFGQGKIPTGAIATTTKYYDPDVPKYSVNPKAAAALLDEMGLKPDANGVRAEIKILPMPYGDAWMRLAEYIRQGLRQIGIASTIENTDPSGFVQKVTNWEYDITYMPLYQYADPALGVSRTYLCSNRRKVFLANGGGYCNESIDAMWDRATKTLSEADRIAIYKKIQQTLADDLPALPLLEMNYPLVVRKALKDAIVSGTGPNDSFRAAYFG